MYLIFSQFRKGFSVKTKNMKEKPIDKVNCTLCNVAIGDSAKN